MLEHSMTLDNLYARFDAIAEGQAPSQDSSAAHRAILARLADNEALATRSGWTAFELKRRGGTGRVFLEGTPPSGHGRDVVPDAFGWADADVAAASPAPSAQGVPV